MEDIHKDLVENLRHVALAPNRWPEDLIPLLVYFLFNRPQAITTLIFSKAAHMNNSALKDQLHQIIILQKQLISKLIQDGIVEGIWDPDLRVENVAMLYMGIPISLNIELVLSINGVNTENFCKRMECLLKRILEKK